MNKFICACLIIFVATVFPATIRGQSAKSVKQPPQVIEAYRVIQRFQEILARDLDFDPAFEATFSKNQSRRREIAIAEGEFSDVDGVDTPTLVSAFKSRMQIIYLLLPLLVAEKKDFPPEMEEILDRKPPKTPQEFNSYASQLKRDATNFRAFVEKLARERPEIDKEIRKFKEDLLKKSEPPTTYLIKPLTAYSKGQVLAVNEPYYRIDGFALIRENGEMRIIGIRLFNLGF